MSNERIYLRGRVWWTYGYDADGEKWQESTHQRDKGAAILAAREIARRYAADPSYRTRSKLTLRVALERVLAFQETAGRAANTIEASTYHAQHLLGWLGVDTPLPSITLQDTTKYLEGRLGEGAHRHTIAKELRMLTQSMRRCAKLGLYVPQVDPRHFVPDELGKVYEPRERWLPRPEYEALVRALRREPPGRPQLVPDGKLRRARQQDHSDYVIAWCNLGLRRSELFDVRPGDYNAARRELRVRGTKSKEADRLVPANEAAHAVLHRRCTETKPFPEWTNVTRDVSRACEELEIQTATPNDFRRTFCSWLCQAGVPERTCAELMGHTSTVMVRAVYGQLDRESLRGAVARI